MNQSTSQSRDLSPLLTSSLLVPKLHPNLITRPGLIKKLDQALIYPLTLLAAPAGFGKTTLLSQWIEEIKEEHPQIQFAWVSLEAQINARNFWRMIVAALKKLSFNISPSNSALLEKDFPPINLVLRVLLNEISSKSEHYILILDDYHHIEEPSIHSTLTFFINNLPPNLHLVLSSRRQPPLPLAQLRARNQLVELREADLRFSTAEITLFCNTLNNLNLSQSEIVALETRTEGWIAGLKLFALSMEGFDELSKHQDILAFTGSQHFILDYLVEEVLQKLPEEIRTFLLHTSIIYRMNASICNAITGQSDGQEKLEFLERSNLFTIPLDQNRHFYRYHHLFRDVLRHQLQQREPQHIFDLHRRAAAWYLQQGQVEDAFFHECETQEWDKAVELITPRISAHWSRGEVRNIISWLGRLPFEILDAHPTLFLYYTRALLFGGKIQSAEQLLKDAEIMLRMRLSTQVIIEDQQLLGSIHAFQTTIAAVKGEIDTALDLGNQTLSMISTENTDIRAHTINSLGMTYFFQGDMVKAEQFCDEAGDLAQQAGNFYLETVARTYQAQSLEQQGQLKQAGEILENLLDQGGLENEIYQTRIPAAGIACAKFGNLLYEWNELEEAKCYLLEAIELGQQLTFGSALWSAYHTLALVRHAQHDPESALELIEEAEHYRMTFSIPIPAKLMKVEHARTALHLGQLEVVERWARTYKAKWLISSNFIEEVEHITLAHLYLYQNKPEEAITLLERILPVAESCQRNRQVIEIRILIALALQAIGNLGPAVEMLNFAITQAQPEGYVRTFVDHGQPMASLLQHALEGGNSSNYVIQLLANFSKNRQTSEDKIPAIYYPVETLSSRELEVLQLIAQGESNQEIAENLIIAVTTAKKHVSNILRKLDVKNRTQAAAIGRLLGLC